MRDEIATLITASRRIIALLGAGEPLSQKDHARLTSLAWNLIAALHARKGPDMSGRDPLPVPPTEPTEPSDLEPQNSPEKP